MIDWIEWFRTYDRAVTLRLRQRALADEINAQCADAAQQLAEIRRSLRRMERFRTWPALSGEKVDAG